MSAAETFGGSRARARMLASWGGVAISLGLAVGGGVWGWRVVEREASGVPFIRAEAGPMRVAPEEPGGDTAEHQGLSVSRIAAGDGEGPLAAEVHLAPRSVGLAAEDMPPSASEMPAIAATDLAVAEALGLDPETLIPASVEVQSEPVRRTEGRQPARGPEAVQLGAFPEEALADAEWQSLLGRFPDLLEGTERRVERVDRDARTFWRLRAAGFPDLADARRVCAALSAGEAECVPVVRH